jgi:heme exporter protein A
MAGQAGCEDLKLIVEELAQSRGGLRLFVGLGFTLGSGEALQLTGPNGSGKTTLLRTLAGLLQPETGRVRFTEGGVDAEIGERCHFVGHANGVNGLLTVREAVEFWAAYLDGRDGAALRAETAIERFGLQSLADLPTAYLSAGQKRRVGLARLLAARRPAWLLDEPTVSLDAATRDLFAVVCNEHLADGGMIVAATHLPLALARARTLDLTPTLEVAG